MFQAGLSSPAVTRAPVFIHSMWRTGSSYVLSRFDTNVDYLTFYEPFNGEIGSRRLRMRAEADYGERHQMLRHPKSSDGYFAVYDRLDPASGKPLWTFARARLPLFDVYNGLSTAGGALLDACCRVATSENRIPVFGFCHSGLQIAQMSVRFGGTHLYLYRDARDQFISYGPTSNDFFMAATILQLLASPVTRGPAIALVPGLRQIVPSVTAEYIKMVPHWLAMRMGRQLWKSLTIDDLYRLFYLSWIFANRAGAMCATRFATADLDSDPALKARIEQAHGIEFSELQSRTTGPGEIKIPFAAIEDEVVTLIRPNRRH